MTTTTELTALLEQATKGPWHAIDGKPNVDYVYSRLGKVASTFGQANARLIALSPDLAARVLELEDENARLRSLLVHVENADYNHTVSGNENFAWLQEIASAGLEANT